jgi:beta-glucosidase
MKQMLENRDLITDATPMQLLLPPSDEPSIAKRITAALTREEKITLLGGVDEFCIPGIGRIGLKPVWTSDATLGIRGWNAPVTDFPAAISLASTFDRNLIQRVGDALGEECRAMGIGVLLGPGVNLARVPVNGRNFEYFGEDPYLCGQMAASYIKGVQSHPVIATVKHFACNNSEYDRHKSNSVVDERSLHELYLPAFKQAVQAGCLAVMTSYNQVNGTYTSEHPYLLDGVLRGDWGFEGLVISDWNSLYSTKGVLACGVDVEMPQAKYLTKEKVVSAFEAGVFDDEQLDKRIMHLLSSYEKAGLFTVPTVDDSLKIGGEAHLQAAFDASVASVVLAKNEQSLLPLSSSQRICLGGDNACKVAQGGGSSMIQWQQKPQTLAQRLAGKVALLPRHWVYSRKWHARVRECDAVVLVVGYDHIEESEAYDRPWRLSGTDIRSIQQAAQLNKHVVVVVQSGGAVETESWQDAAQAILFASYLGSSTADALEALLYGTVNPSGKLPYTVARRLEDYRSMRTYPKDFATTNVARIKKGQGDSTIRSVSDLVYREGLMVGYRQFDTEQSEVAFCFGHGLSYTRFQYGELEVRQLDERTWHLQCMLTNVGDRTGAEVVQLYMHPLDPKIFRPFQELRGFSKVLLKANEQKLVDFLITDEAFSRWDQASWSFTSDAGSYELRIGSSSRDIRLKAVVEYAKKGSHDV